jgi:hypothetical protein
MKIVMICKQDYYITFDKISEILKEKFNITCVAVTFNTRTARILSRGNSFLRIYNFPDFMRENGSAFPESSELVTQFKALDKDFNNDVLSRAMSFDRLLFPSATGTVYQKKVKQYTYNEILRIMYGNYRFWMEIFQKEKPSYIIGGEIGNSSEYLAWAIAKKYNCRYLLFSHTRIMENRFFFCDNPFERVQKLEDTFTALKDKDLSTGERKGLQGFLDAFVSKRSKPQYFSFKNPFMFDFARISRVAKDALMRARVPADRSDRDFMLEDKDQLSFFGLFSHRAIKAVRYLLSLSLFERLPADADYFFFALHVQPEISTLLYGQFYDNQLAVVENICKCLPIGYRLVVKDHPVMVGRRTRGFYRELKKFPNVVLIDPEIDSHEIIKNSSGVITITGTVGIEGMLYEKPVVVLGDTIYNIFDLVYKPDGFRELGSTLRRAITSFKPDRDLLLKFLLAMELSSYEGYIPDPVENPDMLSDQNMGKIAEAIVAETQS